MTRSFAHWSPDYLWSRLKDKIHLRMHPCDPWLTPAVVEILIEHLKKNMSGLEFGSGNSTVWFAQHLGVLTSVEHDPKWYQLVTEKLAAANLINVEYLLRTENGESYTDVTAKFQTNSLEFILVDGIHRGKCVLKSLSKLKPGGILVIDDVHRYLPSASRSPLARKLIEGPVDQDWQRFLELTMDWEYIWTSNGVKDTVIFYKPLDE